MSYRSCSAKTLRQAPRNKRALFIDMSTIAPDVSKSIGEKLQSMGHRFIEAPVTGGTIGAQNATLSILVGGEKRDYDDALPILQAMGKNITHCGPWGAGQGVKLCNQIMGAMNLLGSAKRCRSQRDLILTQRSWSKPFREEPRQAGLCRTWDRKYAKPTGHLDSWSIPNKKTCDWLHKQRRVLKYRCRGCIGNATVAECSSLWRWCRRYPRIG